MEEHLRSNLAEYGGHAMKNGGKVMVVFVLCKLTSSAA